MRHIGISGYRGVSYNKRVKKWQAIIQKFGKQYNLGSFTDPKVASEVYEAAKLEYEETKAALKAVVQKFPHPTVTEGQINDN